MSITIGTRLGPYELVAAIGAGGMGEVYRAIDTRLHRSVAIKILRQSCAEDADRQRRFDREAAAIAAVTHPGICTLHDVGIEAGRQYIVMEYVEGETLAQRLARERLRLRDVLHIGAGLAEALHHAHERGIVHRDLKPANVMLTRAGPKILDFGLATFTVSTASSSDTQSQSELLTGPGVVAGTAQYMSPEQVRAEDCDARSDIFSLGVMLFEMVAGQRPFQGHGENLAKTILSDDAPSLPAGTPPELERLISGCLAKDRAERWQNAHDIALTLRSIEASTREKAAVSSRRGFGDLIALSLLALIAIYAALVFKRSHTTSDDPIRTSIMAPAAMHFNLVHGAVALDRSGRLLAFAAKGDNGRSSIWVRDLSDTKARPIAGTEGGVLPFWSYDSTSLGFFAGEKLKIVDLAHGVVRSLCDARMPWGASWNRDDTILYAHAFKPMATIPSAGGEPAELAPINHARGEGFHAWPFFLPDQRHYLYVAARQDINENEVWIGAIGSPPRKLLLSGVQSQVTYSSGYLLFARKGTLFAQRFDPDRLTITGAAIPVVADVDSSPVTEMASQFSAGESRNLVYGDDTNESQLVWFSRDGKEVARIGQPAQYSQPRLSHDSHRVAVVKNLSSNAQVWIYDIDRNIGSPMTFSGHDFNPNWSPDDRYIAFSSSRDGPSNIYVKLANGSAAERALWSGPAPSLKTVSDWIATDSIMCMAGQDPKVRASEGIWIYFPHQNRMQHLEGGDPRRSHPALSPDGRFIAYASFVSGSSQIEVESIADKRKWQVSSENGHDARWSPNGREIFYYSSDGTINAVDVGTVPDFHAGVPHHLFRVELTNDPGVQYDVSTDGQRFLVNMPVSPGSNSLTLVQNWPALLNKRERQ